MQKKITPKERQMHRYDAVPNQNFPPHLFPFPCACTLILPSFRLDGWTEFFSGREGNALSSCACWILVRPSRRVCHVMCGSGRSAQRERGDARAGRRFGGVWPVSASRYSSLPVAYPASFRRGQTCCWQRTATSGCPLRWQWLVATET